MVVLALLALLPFSTTAGLLEMAMLKIGWERRQLLLDPLRDATSATCGRTRLLEGTAFSFLSAMKMLESRCEATEEASHMLVGCVSEFPAILGRGVAAAEPRLEPTQKRCSSSLSMSWASAAACPRGAAWSRAVKPDLPETIASETVSEPKLHCVKLAEDIEPILATMEQSSSSPFPSKSSAVALRGKVSSS
jgi:hypothetical protein